ncbi:MAG: site-2 protease family protein, partial [Planctomycetota bacterium]
MIGRGLRIGRLFGIPIELHISWFLVLFLVAWTFAAQLEPALGRMGFEKSTPLRWVLGFVAAVLLFGSVLLHELSHSLVAVHYGIEVKRITLFMFGGVAQLGGEPQRPWVEFLVAVAGPLTSAALAGLSYLALLLTPPAAPVVATLFANLVVINLAVTVFNLVPAFPLDGGRMLRALLWAIMGSFRKATLVAATIGRGFGIFLIIFGISAPLFIEGFSLFSGLWLIFIGFFILQAAEMGYISALYPSLFRPHKLGEFLTAEPTTVDANATLLELAQLAQQSPGAEAFAVLDGDRFVGVVTLGVLARVPPELWAQTPVYSVLEPQPPVCFVEANSHIAEAID